MHLLGAILVVLVALVAIVAYQGWSIAEPSDLTKLAIRLNGEGVEEDAFFTMIDLHQNKTTGKETFRKLKQDIGLALGTSIASLYSESGDKIIGVSQLKKLRKKATADQINLYAVPENDLFMWHPVTLGHVTRVKLDPEFQLPGRDYFELHTLSVNPTVLLVPHFMSEEECDHMIELGRQRMKPSPVINGQRLEGDDLTAFRTSSSAAVGSHHGSLHKDLGATKVTVRIQQRAAALTKTPFHFQETLQVVRYEVGQHFWSHCDWINPDQYDSNPELQGHRNRFLTLLLYLNQPARGGQTNFAKANARPGFVEDVANCSSGLNVEPRKGAAVLFYDLLNTGIAAGLPDNTTWHSGCDVLEGEKWAVNLWVDNKRHPTIDPTPIPAFEE